MIFFAIIDLKTQLEQLVDEIEVKSMLWMFLFIICMIGVFGKLLLFGVQMAWGISKFLLTIVILPLILIGIGGRRLALYRISDSDCDWDYSHCYVGKNRGVHRRMDAFSVEGF